MTKMTLKRAVQIARRQLAGEEVDVSEARQAYDALAAMKIPEEGSHAGLPVAGYAPTQSDTAVSLVTQNKHREEKILRVIDALESGQTPDGESITVDRRWLSIARTDLEKGFMALNRSIFKPQRIEGDI